MLSSMFSKMTQIFVARDIQRPWVPTDITPETPLEEAMQAVLQIDIPNPVEIYPVREDGSVVGIVDWPMLDDAYKKEYHDLGLTTPEELEWANDIADVVVEGETSIPPDVRRKRVGEVMAEIGPPALVSADTALFAVAKMLCQGEGVLFVVDGNQLTGTLEYRDLSKTPFRMCLLAMLIQMEELALELVTREPLKSWRALSPNRQAKAREIYAREYEEDWKTQERQRSARAPLRGAGAIPSPMTDWRTAEVKGGIQSNQLLQRAQFCDKREIIVKRNLLPGLPEKWINDVFRKAERLRNQCAHSGGFSVGGFTLGSIVDRKGLWELIADVHKMIREIIKAGRLDAPRPPEEQLLSSHE